MCGVVILCYAINCIVQISIDYGDEERIVNKLFFAESLLFSCSIASKMILLASLLAIFLNRPSLKPNVLFENRLSRKQCKEMTKSVDTQYSCGI